LMQVMERFLWRMTLLGAILASAFASDEPDFISTISDDTLGEAQKNSDQKATERLTELLANYKDTNSGNWLSLEAMKDPMSHHEDLPTWYRHLHETMVSTSASNRREAQDATFILREPLCKPNEDGCPATSEGIGACFSLEAANYKNFYLSKMVEQDQLELEERNAERAADQTLCMVSGLAGSHTVSLQVLSKPGFFVSVRESLLRLCDNKPNAESECGMLSDDDFKQQATALVYQGLFNGMCHGPMNPKECDCLLGWLGHKCDQQCPGGYDEALGTCNGRGKCALDKITKSAQCTCNEGWLGVSCTEACPEHNGLICSGEDAGTCWLSPADGGACKCKDQRKGDLCEFTCPGVKDAKSPPCYGAGTCELSETKDSTVCDCDRGYLGAECDLKCPVGDGGLVCSGFGKCGIGKLGTASCVCGPERRGAACELQCPKDPAGFVCSRNGACVVSAGEAACACEDGFLGERCQFKCAGVVAGRVCSGHGKCEIRPNEHGTDQAECLCDPTHGGEDCLLPCEVDDQGNPCNGHGVCEAEGKCGCDGGFLGKACEFECPVKDKQVCASHGKCVIDAPESEDDEASVNCECHRGFMGPECHLECPKNPEGVVCAGRGKCGVDGGHAVCKCETGARGKNCQFVCPGSLSSDHVCSGHGECHAHPADTPIAAQCTACDEGYVGIDCSLRCPNIDEKGRPCGGNGKCMETSGRATCVCEEGFLGDGCEFDCPRDRAGRACAAAGQCSVVGNKAQCACEEGYLGNNCDLICPMHTETKAVCSGHGECVIGPDGAKADCECEQGFTGRSCNEGCPVGGNKLSCSGHGECAILGTQGGCKCDDGFSGEDCSQYTCSAPNAVYNKVTAQCICPLGNICCERKSLEAKRVKEDKIARLEQESEQLHDQIQETQKMLQQ